MVAEAALHQRGRRLGDVELVGTTPSGRRGIVMAQRTSFIEE